ncbi:MAG TPA: secretin N-terminal domain-containing protein [Candidatus Limnocylindrales bacterium]|nr:secretin N-terminal domain-containing protein [Candidatus Limnocylindrales bacterium]
MKLKLCMLTLGGLVAWSSAAIAQTNTPTSDAAAAPSTVTATNDAAATATAAVPAENTTTGTAVAAADAAAQPAADAAAQPATQAAAADATAQPVVETATPDAASSAAATNAPVQPGGVIPLIVMDDVPLTDAIKNLARQAGLNYILDPKVAFGQPGPDGRPIPQPSVSIRWENVTAVQALTALLGTYNLQLVEDPKSKIARVTVKDPAAPDPLVTKIIQLKYAGPTNILSTVASTLTDKRSKVVADVRTSQLIVVATEKEMVDVDQLVERLDTKTKQVLIEARLLETSMNPSTSKGVDWSGTLQSQNITFGNGFMSGQSTTTMPGATTTATLPSGRTVNSTADSTVSTVLNSIIGAGGLGAATGHGFTPGTFFLNADGVKAVLSFLNKYADAKVISTPRTVTLDNEPAKIEVTRASPIINITPGTVQVSGGSQVTYTNLGVILNVTPRISADSYVNLKVVPEVSRVFDTIKRQVSTGNGSGFYEADEYDIRKIETRVMVPSGNTLVLGGLVQDDVRSGNTKVPVLGDIPVVGYLFRADTKSRQKSNLLVFITPTIVEDEDFQPTKTDFLKTPVPPSDSVEGPWSSWDSGKPRDWSNIDMEAYHNAKFDDTVVQPASAPSTPASVNP